MSNVERQFKLMQKMRNVLLAETTDPIDEQRVIELLVANFAMRQGDEWEQVANAMCIHSKEVCEHIVGVKSSQGYDN